MGRQRYPRKQADGGGDVAAALRALDADELRAFIAETLEGLDPDERGPIQDALLRRAAARGGYRPAAPAPAMIDEVLEFAEAARRVAQAEPMDVDEYLRRGVAASLAGEHATARRIFEALLFPIAEAEIDLGQHEMVEEVLSVDLHDCVGRYLSAVYIETPARDRVDAILTAIEKVNGLGAIIEPVRAMEQSLGRALPESDAFLDAWITRLESSSSGKNDWESDHERWLRDAVARREGTLGLARIARATKRPQAVSAWCDAVVQDGDWKKALAAYEEAVTLVTSGLWTGEFLDGAALAAATLGRKDATKKLEAAWVGAPSLARLLRWLVADGANASTICKRASATVDASPTRAKRLHAFLHVIVGDISSAAKALKSAPGLGWSSDDHPGHLLFATFVWMLADGAPNGVGAAVVEVLKQAPRSLLESTVDADDPSTKLTTPMVIEVLEQADVRSRMTVKDRAAALDAMRTAASKRTDGVTGERRRRHYEHAATLVGCCVEADRQGSAAWLEALRARTSRFPAYQEALRAALGGGRRYLGTRSFVHGE
jgi:tetratricopeptide (TPR) repeat protein